MHNVYGIVVYSLRQPMRAAFSAKIGLAISIQSQYAYVAY